MSLRIRRGLAASRTSITPLEGEFLYTTDTKSVFIGDGATAGGVAIGGSSTTAYLQVANATLLFNNRMQVANTNALVNDRLQVANATLLFNNRMQVANTIALVNDRIQVANATLLINDRLQIANATLLINNRMQVANTNALVNDRLQVANAATLYATKISPTTSGVFAHTGRATISTNLSVTGNTVISGLSANGSLGTANYVLKTNGTTTFWGEAAAGGGGGTSLGAVIAMNLIFG